MTGGEQAVFLLEDIADVQEPFAVPFAGAQPDGNLHAGLRGHGEVLHGTGPDRTAVPKDGPFHPVGGQVAEEVLVIHANAAVREFRPDVLVPVAHLVHVRVGNTVRADEAVVAEILVGGIVAVEVAAVGIDGHAVLVLPPQGLVYEVPDEAALVLGVLPDEVPVLLETAFGIAHRMGVLALDEGLTGIGVGGVLLAAAIIQVHRAVDVRLAGQVGLLVLAGAGRILGLHPVIGVVEGRAVAGLVAERPEDDGRMVEIPLDIAHVALQVGEFIGGVLGKGPFAVAHAVGLEVGLGHHVDAVLVAEVVPIVVVGIVAGADCVDIELLHDEDVLQHPLPGHHVTAVRVQFVAVGALEQDRLAVHEKLPAGELDLPESDFHRNGLAAAGGLQGVQVRGLGCPLLRGREGQGRGHRPLAGDAAGSYAFPLSVKQFQAGLAALALEFDADVQGPVPVGGVQVRRDPDILDALLGAGVEVAVAGYAAVAEEVLVFQVSAVAPAKYLESDEVLLPGKEVLRHIELGLQFAVLAVSDKLAVHPEIDVGSDGSEVEEDVLPGPGGGNLEFPAV